MRTTFAAAALAGIVGFGSLAYAQTAPVSITAARLAAADTSSNDWLTYGRDYGAHRYSGLTTIDRDNVKGLQLAWSKSLGKPVSLEGTPIVNGDTMYVTTGKDAVYAFDAKTGEERWHYIYAFNPASAAEACCNTNNRGVTLYKDLVVTATLDAKLIALDAKTGKLRWSVTVAPYTQGYTITSPPLLVKHRLITGVAGGEYGIRGFIAAYDADTGKQVWRHYVIPSPGRPGYDTWEKPGTAARPGGSTWVQGTYDPGLDTIYWGVGNPTPLWDPNANEGKLLYTDSMLALDADTGHMKWYFQYTPHDIWDYDGVNEAVIADVPINGKTVKAVAQANRNGIAYLLDRTNGKVIWAKPFVDKINFATVNEATGKLTYNPQQIATARAMKPFMACPGNMGGKNWEPTAYDPAKHLFFIPVIESCDQIVPLHQHFKRGQIYLGGTLDMPKYMIHGSVVAIDLSTGKTAWKTRFQSPQIGGALVTAGGLVFSGDPSGKLRALDEDTGKVLWEYKTESGVNAPPVTYAVDGQQYVAVLAGSGGAWPIYFIGSTPWLKTVPNGAKLYVFKLEQKTAIR